MAELARGAIADRPWGRTLGALGTRGLSGELTITADGKPYRVAFASGAIVGASSPLASDAAVRVALTGGLISSTQVNDITRRIATSPHRDEIDVVAEAARLGPDQARQLRRRLVAQRAARTFSVERGDFLVDDRITVPVIPGNELDVRAIIYMGAKSNLSEERLAIELNQFGAWFKLTPDGIADLAQFGFTETEKPALQKLVDGINLEELERMSPDLGERGVRAIVYALAAVGACEAELAPRTIPGRVTRDSIPPIQPPRPGNTSQAPTLLRRAATNAPTTITAKGTGSTRAETPDGMTLRAPRATTPPNQPRTQTPSSPPDRATSPGRTPTPTTSPGRPPTPTDRATSPHDPVGRTPTPTPSNLRPLSPTGRAPTPPTTPVTSRTATTPVSRTATPTTPISSHTPTPNDPTTGRTPTPSDHPAFARTATPSTPPTSRTMTPISQSRTATGPVISRTVSGNRSKVPSAPPGTPDDVRIRQPSGQHQIVQPLATPRPQRGSNPPPVRPRRNTAATVETETLIRDRLALVDRGADHYNLLGIAQDASPDLIRAAYFTLARKLHPDRLASLGIVDGQRDAQRLFAQINAAFAVLNDPAQRTDYNSILSRGGVKAVRAEDSKADELAMRIMHAEEAFKRGEMALRREQLDAALQEFTTAVELQPTEPEYQALFVWTRFVAASDKPAIASQTRQQLLRTADKLDTSPTARFYLGRVERILGREKEALVHFYEVLKIKPNHAEASSEIRILEARLKKR